MVHGRSLAGPHDTVGGGVGHMGIWWLHRWPHRYMEFEREKN